VCAGKFFDGADFAFLFVFWFPLLVLWVFRVLCVGLAWLSILFWVEFHVGKREFSDVVAWLVGGRVLNF